MLYVRELLFDDWNEDHIAQHSVRRANYRVTPKSCQREKDGTGDTGPDLDSGPSASGNGLLSIISPFAAALSPTPTLTNTPISMVIATYGSTLVTSFPFPKGGDSSSE